MRTLNTSKKGALELSVGTIVILVLAMSMLILGIVLIRNIFFSATGSIDLIDDGVRSEINKLFSDSDKKLVVRLPDNQASIAKGDDYGIAFGVRNTETGTANAALFSYTIQAESIERGCDLDLAEANRYLRIGYSGQARINPGDDPQTFLVKIQPSESAPLCEIQYKIDVLKDGSQYATEYIFIRVTGR